jgi:hypothetical protein
MLADLKSKYIFRILYGAQSPESVVGLTIALSVNTLYFSSPNRWELPVHTSRSYLLLAFSTTCMKQ